MVRDFDLIRAILLRAQQKEPGSDYMSLDFGLGHSKEKVYEHVALLIEAGLVVGHSVPSFGGGISLAEVDRLTWAGHDFVDSLADESIWLKAKEFVLKPAVSFSFDVLKEWLKQEAKTKLGLST